MGEVYFYHFSGSRPEADLPGLVLRALDRGWWVAIRADSAAALDRLDDWLWTYDEASFLPHGRAGSPAEAEQPVLLAEGALPAGIGCLMALGGAAVAAGEAAGLGRTCILFDGDDPAARDRARQQWRELLAAGVALKYMSRESGRWEQKAEAGASREAAVGPEGLEPPTKAL